MAVHPGSDTSFSRQVLLRALACDSREEKELERLLQVLVVEIALITIRRASADHMPDMELYRGCLQKKARETNNLLFVVKYMEQILSEESSDERAILYQYVFQRASTSELHLPGYDVFMQIPNIMAKALAIRSLQLINRARSLYFVKIRINEIFFEKHFKEGFAEQWLHTMGRFFLHMDQKKAEGDRLRNEFLERAQLKRPPVLRLIDCIATARDERRVVLMDWEDCVQDSGFSSISHTYGQDVYEAFNCTCASICRVASKPRCSFNTCPHNPADANAANTTQLRVVQDILKMCDYLWEAGVHYAWHDGVCIAQHDEAEVRETIQHIGWVYANGKETIVFLHYVGEPRAPIWASDVFEDACRWQTRVWTLQEAALSKRRRYCIRVGEKEIGDWHQSYADMVRNVRLWYEAGSSSVKVVEEETFYKILVSLAERLVGIYRFESQLNPFDMALILSWLKGITSLISALITTCFSFPTVDDALLQCAQRESKHRGDRMNSILTLAGVKDFVAPKDTKLEASALEFYEKQGQKGLARALFSIRRVYVDILYGDANSTHEVQMHKWLPVPDYLVDYFYRDGLENGMRLTVLENGRLEVRSSENGDDDALLCCMKVRIVIRPREENAKVDLDSLDEKKKALEDWLNTSNARGYRSVLEMNYAVVQTGIYLSVGPPSYPVGTLSTNLTHAQKLDSLVHPRSIPNNEGSDQDHIFMKDGESFDAHLVTTGTNYDSSCMLLLYGDNILNGEVTKIGVFKTRFAWFFKTLMNMKLEKVILT